MKTLELIKKTLNQKTSKSWFVNGNMVTVLGENEGSDYSVSLESDGIVVRATGMSWSFLTRKSLVDQLNLWIAVDCQVA